MTNPLEAWKQFAVAHEKGMTSIFKVWKHETFYGLSKVLLVKQACMKLNQLSQVSYGPI